MTPQKVTTLLLILLNGVRQKMVKPSTTNIGVTNQKKEKRDTHASNPLSIMIFQWLAKKLCFLGKLLGISTGLLLFAVIGTVLDNPPVSLERNTMNAQYISVGTFEMTNWPRFDMCPDLQFGKCDIVISNCMSSSKPHQFAPIEHLSKQDRKLDFNNLDICPCIVSGFVDDVFAGVSILTECQNLDNTEESKCSESSHPKPSNTCHEFQSVCTPNNTCKIKQGDYLVKVSSSYLKTVKDESEQFLGNKAGTSAIYEVEVNNGLVRQSYNTWCSNVKNSVSSGASRENMDVSHPQVFLTNVFLLKYNILNLLSLILLLVDGMFGLMGRRPGIGIGIAIIVLSLGFVLKSENGLHPTLFKYDLATLIYGMAHSLMLVSLMLEQANREQLSHLLAGVAYAGVTIGLVGYNFSCLPVYYTCVGVPILFIFILIAGRHGCSLARTV